MNNKLIIGRFFKVIGGILLIVMLLFTGRELVVGVEYNYPNYTNSQYVYGDLEGPMPGDAAIDFVATDLNGNVVRLTDFLGKVIVLTTGSATCPMYVSKVNPMNKLAKKRKDVVFLVLYVREAHPGKNMPKHESFEQKLEYAKLMKEEEQEHRLLVVDDLAGSAHKAYGAWPNMAYIINKNGVVQLRHKWVDPNALELALNQMDAGQPITNIGFQMLAAPSDLMERVMNRAGEGAMKDFVLSAPGLPYHMFEEHYTQ
jgi:hypothetical protein